MVETTNETVSLIQDIIKMLTTTLGPEQFKNMVYGLCIIIGLTLIKAVDIFITALKNICDIFTEVIRKMAEGICCVKKLLPCL